MAYEGLEDNKNAEKFNMDLVKTIIDEVRNGANIKTACEKNGISFQSWCNWRDKHTTVFDLYVKARQDKAEGLESEIDRIMLLLENKEIEPSGANVLIQTLKWKLAKFYPKMFGDKLDVTTDGEKINSQPPIFGNNPLDGQ